MRAVVDADGVCSEDFCVVIGGEGREVVAESLPPAGVGGGCEADRPVGAGEEAVGAEGFDYGIEIGSERFKGPGGPYGFGDHAGELAGDVGTLAEFADVVAPGLEFAGCDSGFGDVVEDELLVGMAVYEADGFFELMLEDEDVVDKSGLGEGTDAAIEVGSVEEAWGLGLDYVTEACQFRFGY